MKFKQFLLISSILLVFFISFSMVNAADNSFNQTLSNSDVETELTISSESPEILNSDINKGFDDVQKSIKNAKDNDIIVLDGNYTSSGKTINISKSVTIEGSSNGATLNANSKSNVFYIENGNEVTLKNLNIINSKGVAISSYESCLTIINCSFSNNKGVLESSESDVIIEDSNFNKNKLLKGYYYVVHSSLGNLKVNNCNFTSNPAAIRSDDDNLLIDSCNFINNGGEYGRAIQASGGLVNNSIFKDNEGAIVSYINFTVENCKFISNSASDCASIVHYGEITPKNYDGTLSIINSTFDNSTISEFGYAIYSYCSDVKLINSNITSSNSNDSIYDVYIKLGKFINETSSFNSSKVKVFDHIPSKYVGKKLTTTFDSKKYFSVRLIETDDGSYSSYPAKALFKIYKGNELIKKFYKKADSFGRLRYRITTKLPVGKYKVVIQQCDDHYNTTDFVSYIKIKKAKTIVKAKKVKSMYKKSKYFKIFVKNKVTKKKVKGLKLKVKVYWKHNGKKYKIFKIRTNKKGIAKFNTKKIGRGKHKVVIRSLNKNYKVYKKSKIIIR